MHAIDHVLQPEPVMLIFRFVIFSGHVRYSEEADSSDDAEVVQQQLSTTDLILSRLSKIRRLEIPFSTNLNNM